MRKDHYDSQKPQNSTPPTADMLKTFSTLMGNLQQNEPKAPAVPENYNNKKFSKLIQNHDRISREIDRKYNNGRPSGGK